MFLSLMKSSLNFLIVSSKYVYLSNFIISCSTSNRATNYGHKVLYKHILSEQQGLPEVCFVYDEEQVKSLDCVVQVQSSWQEHSEFVVYIIPVRKKRN